MLSKSQARLFFILGTVLFSSVFVFLTIDTAKKIPAQTNQSKITPEVRNGKSLWEKNNCMGCHTILGEGAYYAPELTKAYDRRGAEWLKVFLKDPQAMYPGDRKMVQYNFTDKEISDIIAFLEWIGKMDLNGFPAKPTLTADVAVMSSNTSTGSLNQPEKFKQICSACHSIGGKGGAVGPALDTVGRKFNAEYMHKWISDPQSVKPGTKMPKLPLSDTEKDELVSFLTTLK